MWLLLLTYACLIIFVAGLGWRIYKYASLPVHLRWELYPVAHEIGKPYGGSYLEDEGWWRRPRKINLLGESTVFLREIIFFREYFRSNRRFWLFVYPFHLGLFLLVLWVVMLLIGAILALNGLTVSAISANLWLQMTFYLTLVSGITAFILGVFGTVGLLLKRSFDEDLRNYTAPIDYFNLLSILLIFLTGLLFWTLEDMPFNATRGFVQGLLSFKAAQVSPLMTANIVLSVLFLAYMPFTRMVHYVAKYFTYHKIRWDDEPISRGSKLEGKVRKLLAWHESWSAPHIRPGETWSEQAAGTGVADTKEASK